MRTRMKIWKSRVSIIKRVQLECYITINLYVSLNNRLSKRLGLNTKLRSLWNCRLRSHQLWQILLNIESLISLPLVKSLLKTKKIPKRHLKIKKLTKLKQSKNHSLPSCYTAMKDAHNSKSNNLVYYLLIEIFYRCSSCGSFEKDRGRVERNERRSKEGNIFIQLRLI